MSKAVSTSRPKPHLQPRGPAQSTWRCSRPPAAAPPSAAGTPCEPHARRRRPADEADDELTHARPTRKMPDDEAGRRRRGGADRRRRPDRRPDPHLPDADGRDSHAQPPARRWPWPSTSSAAASGSATTCWPPTTCCRRRSACWRAFATAALRLDRTIEVSVINLREKRRLLKLLDAEPAHAAST